ncbi:MAG: TraC family protein, partial [Geminicoccaceae bacterium]
MTDKRIAANRVPYLLRLHAHDPERHLFACDDRSLAFGFLCRPLSGGDDATEQRLRSFLALDWPTGTLLGFHLMASSAIHQLVEEMLGLRAHETDPLLARTSQDRAEHLLAGVDAPYPETGTLVRDFQLVVSVKLPHAGPMPTEPDLVAAHGHQRRARQALEDLQLLSQPMDASDACYVLNQCLCRGPHATWRRLAGMDLHDDLLLAEQAVDSDLDLRVDRDGIWLGQTRLAVLSVKSFPGSLRFGMTARLIGDLRQGQRGLKAPFVITTSVYYPDPQKTEARIAKRRAWTTHQLHSPLQRWLPNLAGRAADLDAMVMSLEEGHRPVQLATTLLLYGRDMAEAERAVTAATAYWSEVRFNAPPDRYICLPLFLQALPFNADRESIPDLGRYRTMTTQHAARLLPVFAEWSGSGTPALTFVSRLGQLIRFDLFDSRTNYNATIAAESGSGKSFLANYLITSYLSLGAQVFVIDVGKSYQNLCELLGGSFIDV